MITLEQYLGQHAKEAAPGELTDEIRANAKKLIERVNRLLTAEGMEHLTIRSGWRPAAFNANFTHTDAIGTVVRGGAPKSRHMTGEGVDVADPNGALDARLDDETLARFDLYREAIDATPSWCHLQTAAPKSGHRTYLP